ncbi:peroxisome biogenesis protein 7-like [Trifolium medium]|uniref:Peroxisome biogenesis protein 7-like n=1 Tax=Trifolium medium TaxID=97028 RepID=A0A392QFD5_9FABA|nr:peroxisome biogenesis protein 7-like [Trifolium medium]
MLTVFIPPFGTLATPMFLHRRPAIVLSESGMFDALVSRYDQHTEFAVGVDMSVLVEGLIASTGWDELVYVWQHGTDPRAS